MSAPATFEVKLIVETTDKADISYGCDVLDSNASTSTGWSRIDTVDGFDVVQLKVTVSPQAAPGAKVRCVIEVEGDAWSEGEAVGPGSSATCLAVNP